MKFDEIEGGIILFCRYCGKKIDDNDSFCSHCGTSVKTIKQIEERSKKFLLVSFLGIIVLVIIMFQLFYFTGGNNKNEVSSKDNDLNILNKGFTDINIIDEKSAIKAATGCSDTLVYKNALDE